MKSLWLSDFVDNFLIRLGVKSTIIGLSLMVTGLIIVILARTIVRLVTKEQLEKFDKRTMIIKIIGMLTCIAGFIVAMV